MLGALFDHQFVAAIALSRGENWEEETSPFIRFGIQLYDAFLTTVLLRHGQLHHVGMITFSDALLLAAVPSYAKERREIVACAGNRKSRTRATRLAAPLWHANDKRLCNERVRAEGKGTALGTALGVT